ncbi:MAG: tRNA pseudouridine(38-40) synthase TruA [Clostridia bacterium]|nr:tRNA pseudouridine(38-40) synthase TruA [Clostridia bacterium]
MERNLLLTIQYDGSGYHGWQIQENARSVQGAFQEALKNVLGVQPDIKACSRTDTGVHAKEFCLSMKLSHGIPEERLVGALNHFLPDDMAVLACRAVPEDFHARYSCKGKRYVYEIHNSAIRSPFLRDRALHYYHPIDENRLNAAAQHFLGSHDFTSFCTLDKREMGDFTRTVTESHVTREGDMVRFTVAADGFLYNMVRIMVGTLLAVQQGRFEPGDIPGILAGKNRKLAGPTAPACGLYLAKVFYDLPEDPAGK